MKKIMFFLMVLSSVLLCGCSRNGEDTYALVLSCDTPYCNAIANGFSEQADLLGKKAVIQTPEEMSVSEQYQILQKLLGKDLAGLAILPNSSSLLSDITEEFAHNGVPVISVSSGINSEGVVLGLFPFDSTEVAKELLDRVSAYLDGYGQIAVLSTTNQEPMTESIISEIRSLLEEGTYPDIQLTEIAYGNNDLERCTAKMQHLVENYPNLDFVLTLSSEATIAAASYITENGLDESLHAAGYGFSEEMNDYPDEAIPFYYTYDPEELGKLIVRILEETSSRESSYEEGDLIELDGLGEFEVFGYGEIYELEEGENSFYPGIVIEGETTWNDRE